MVKSGANTCLKLGKLALELTENLQDLNSQKQFVKGTKFVNEFWQCRVFRLGSEVRHLL